VATGSGAVALALALRFRGPLSEGGATLIASDVSPDALTLAAENLEAHDVDHVCTLVCADLLAPAGDTLPKPDVLIANLPYVPSAEVDERWGSLGFEPRVALDGGPDGLDLLRRLLGEVPTRANAGATLLLEVGVGQADDITAMAPAGAVTTVVPDLAGLDRVLAVRMPEDGT
jgi:release factor glutamine methyltransferase